MRRYFRSDCRFYSYGSVGLVLITISLNTFDRRTFKHLKEAPIKHSIVMFITIILILMSHNLAIGVVIDTLIYYVIHFIFTKKGRPSL